MCLQFPYANHGAGIWIPTFALVQNHPNDARGRQMEEADKQMALLQAHRSWRQNSTQKWKHVERYGTNGDFMRFNDESPQLQIGLYSFMHLIMHIYIYIYNQPCLNICLLDTDFADERSRTSAPHVVGSKPGVHPCLLIFRWDFGHKNTGNTGFVRVKSHV